jgi:hypothetical protein
VEVTDRELDRWAIFTINYATRAPDGDIPALLEPWILKAARRVKERNLFLDDAGRDLVEILTDPRKVNPVNWLHYVGGFYTPKKFISEARKFGITRRIAPNVAKTTYYGDHVILLDWRQGSPVAFAEFVIDKIAADHEIMQAVTMQLKEQGHIVEERAPAGSGGVSQVDRECGSFTLGGGAVVDDETTIKDIVEKGQKVAVEKGAAPKWMIGGWLTRVFVPPLALEPKPPFSRGFLRVPGNPFSSNGAAPERMVISVENYRKRAHKRERVAA